MRKRLLSVLMALCMVLSLAPTMAWASMTESVTIDGQILDASNPYYHNGTSTDEDGYTDDNEEGASASFANGVLTLNGLHVNNGQIKWNGTYDDLDIVLEEGSVNTVVTTSGSAIVSSNGMGSFGPSLKITGNGTLYAISTASNGMWVWKDITIGTGSDHPVVFAQGDVNVGICTNANNVGVITINSGDVTAIGGKYGISGDVTHTGGEWAPAKIEVKSAGKLTARGGTQALKIAPSIDSEVTNISVKAAYDGNGSAGTVSDASSYKSIFAGYSEYIYSLSNHITDGTLVLTSQTTGKLNFVNYPITHYRLGLDSDWTAYSDSTANVTGLFEGCTIALMMDGDTAKHDSDIQILVVDKYDGPTTPVTPKLSFDANGGTGTMAALTECTPVDNGAGGTAYKFVLPTCSFAEPANKEFDGWSTDGTNKIDGTTITVTADTTVKALWKDKAITPADTYSIFDAVIPFASVVDCQRTTSTTVGDTQKVGGFAYVCSADNSGARINTLISGVVTNPDNYYYKFSKNTTDETKIDLTLYTYDDSAVPYAVSTKGYIQSYGENCFIYVAGTYNSSGYGSFVSFRDKEYHLCGVSDAGCKHSSYSDKDTCIACGCGDSFVIAGANPSISTLEALPKTGDLVAMDSYSLNVRGTHTFPAAEEGYTTSEALNVIVRNTGSEATGELDITLSGANADSFTLSKAKTEAIVATDKDEFTVVPKTNLAADTYTATVTVGAGEKAQSFNVSFTVNPAPTYTITTSDDGNGSATASANSAAAGTEITLTATPNTGYEFDKWEVVSGGVTITDNKFTMPSEAVTVKACFKAIPVDPTPTPTPSTSSSSKPTYPAKLVEDADVENGNISFSKTRAKAGRSVTITVTPDAGYALDKLVILDDDGKAVSFKDNGNGTFTFTMPKGGVEVEPFFKAVKATVVEEPKEIILIIDSVIVSVDGTFIVNDVAPVIRGERTMLPIRVVAENLGATVTWSEADQSVTIVKGDTEIVIYIGEGFALVNGDPVELDAPAFIANDRTYLPVRFVAENLDTTVSWNGDTQEVTIVPNK